jgi:hypothetical protein
MKAVLHLSMSVKSTMEIISEPMITYDFRLFDPSEIDPPIITGKSGSTHGASTVSTPAINESKRNVIC